VNIGFGTYFTKSVTWGIIAAVINAILFLLGNRFNGSPMHVIRPGQTEAEPVNLIMVLILSIVPVIVAAILYFLLQRTARASLIFSIIAIILFILFFFVTQGAAQSPLTNWVLQIMHLVVAICAVEAIARSIGTYRLTE